MKMTGIAGVNSFNLDSWFFHVEPVDIGTLSWLAAEVFLETSHCRHILSRGHSFLRAMDCMIAVKKNWGLKKPASQMQVGMLKSETQLSSSRMVSKP